MQGLTGLDIMKCLHHIYLAVYDEHKLQICTYVYTCPATTLMHQSVYLGLLGQCPRAGLVYYFEYALRGRPTISSRFSDTSNCRG